MGSSVTLYRIQVSYYKLFILSYYYYLSYPIYYYEFLSYEYIIPSYLFIYPTRSSVRHVYEPVRVRVRVALDVPAENPHPRGAFGGFL